MVGQNGRVDKSARGKPVIPVSVVIEPATFDRIARLPGNAWLARNPNAKRPLPLWKDFTPDLERGFRSLCGYAAMLDPTGGTVDHYLSFRSRPDLAYQWTNYRFASGALNASKRTSDANVLDPHEVGEGWFEIILPSLQMRVTDSIPAQFRAKAEFTIKRLKLRDGERVVRWRQQWYQLYLSGDLTLEGLRQVAPLIADAIELSQHR